MCDPRFVGNRRYYKGKFPVTVISTDKRNRKYVVKALEDIPIGKEDEFIPAGEQFVTVVRLLWRKHVDEHMI